MQRMAESKLSGADAGAGPLVLGLNEQSWRRLGLKAPPTDPLRLRDFLLAEDAADAIADADEFSRGIRRAVRIQCALTAGLHKRSGVPWKDWVEVNFKVGYACLNRYQVAAQLQLGLIERNLPLLVNEGQSRALAPFRKHEKFWEMVASFTKALPPAKEIEERMPRLLGMTAVNKSGARIRLHRILVRVLQAIPSGQDRALHEALVLIRQAVAVLEKGGAS
jgi:hypothetical protein